MKFAMTRPIIACAFAVLLYSCAGCTTTVFPPRRAADPVSVYLTDYGRHSSLLMPDPASNTLKEYAFGDWNWFAVNHNTSGDIPGSMLFSAGSTLARRHVESANDAAAVKHATGAYTVAQFTASGQKVTRLMKHLDRVFDSHLDTITYNPLSGMWFVRSNEPYSAWHNCNHITRNWLHFLDCRTRGLGAFSKFKVVESKLTPPPATPPA